MKWNSAVKFQGIEGTHNTTEVLLRARPFCVCS